MLRIVGNNITVFFKNEKEKKSSFFGFLIDCDEECIYVKGEKNVFGFFKADIDYFVINEKPNEENNDNNQSDTNIKNVVKEKNNTEFEKTKKDDDLDNKNFDSENVLKVFVDNSFLTDIPVSKNIDLNKWNNDIFEIIYDNDSVINVLNRKVQKSIQHSPGKINIITVKNNEETNNNQHEQKNNSNDSFSVNNFDMVDKVVKPSQMISRLNKVSSNNNKKQELDKEQE